MGTITKTIKIHVMFFASLSDYLRVKELDLDIEDKSTIKDLQNLLFNKFKSNMKWNRPLLYAVNQNFATLDTKLNEGDEVVFMPFVSGG